MPDLEKLLTDRQDQLRGRPEDWIDRFGDWRRRIDWASVIVFGGIIAIMLGLLGLALSL